MATRTKNTRTNNTKNSRTKRKALGDFEDQHHTEMDGPTYLRFIDKVALKMRIKSGGKTTKTVVQTTYNLSIKEAKRKAFQKYKR